jgi:hypothetical protein
MWRRCSKDGFIHDSHDHHHRCTRHDEFNPLDHDDNGCARC